MTRRKREGMNAEAKRRGVTVWQVRKERGATWANTATTRPGPAQPEHHALSTSQDVGASS